MHPASPRIRIHRLPIRIISLFRICIQPRRPRLHIQNRHSYLQQHILNRRSRQPPRIREELHAHRTTGRDMSTASEVEFQEARANHADEGGCHWELGAEPEFQDDAFHVDLFEIFGKGVVGVEGVEFDDPLVNRADEVWVDIPAEGMGWFFLLDFECGLEVLLEDLRSGGGSVGWWIQ